MGLTRILLICLTTSFLLPSLMFATETPADLIKLGQSLYDEGKLEEAGDAAMRAVAADGPIKSAREWELAKWLYWTFAMRSLSRDVAKSPTTRKDFSERWSIMKDFIKGTPKGLRDEKLLSYSDFVHLRLTLPRQPQKTCRQFDEAVLAAAALIEKYYERAKIVLPRARLREGKATVLYFNDAHQLLPVVDSLSTRGGVARVKTIVDEVREECRDALVIFGGDLAGGTLFGGIFKGEPQVDLFNKIPINGASFGQHDFDFGLAQTLKLVSQSRFPWFSSNLRSIDGELLPKVQPYLVLTSGGLKVAFIGLTKAMETTTREGNVRELSINEAVNATLKALRKEDVDVYIAITQMPLSDNVHLLKDFPKIAASLTEEQFEERTNVHYVDERPIIAPCGNQGSIVRLDLTTNRNQLSQNVRVYPVNEKVEYNPLLRAYGEKYHNEMEKRLGEKIAHLEVDLDGMMGRSKESPAGNLIADAFREHFNADVALMQGGGIRASLKSGPFTKKSAWSLLPFANRVWLLEMKGKTLLAALNHGLLGREKQMGNLLQISGGRYEVNGEGSIQKLFVKGRPISLEKEYKVALPSYLAKGGGDFLLFTKCKALVSKECQSDAEVLIDYCLLKGRLQPKVEGRIVIEQ